MKIITNKQTQIFINKNSVTHIPSPAPGPEYDVQGRHDYLIHVTFLQEKVREMYHYFIKMRLAGKCHKCQSVKHEFEI